jgi:radical SAM-linked protein
VSESKQRWRIVFARDDDARFLSHLDTIHLWERAFRRGDIPVAMSEGFSPRPRLVFAAPLPLGMLAEHELADLYLAERLTRPDLRTRLAEGMPRGYRLVDMRDEWVGGPAVATQLVAADYRMTLLGVAEEQLGGAVARLIAASTLRREKHREKKVTAYDLRPLLIELQVRPPDAAADATEPGDAGLAAGLWMRLRHAQDGGSGRADEVVAAVAEELGMTVFMPSGSGEAEAETAPEAGPSIEPAAGGPPLEIVRPVRERLWLVEELGARSTA